MSSDESIKSFENISSTPHPKKMIGRPSLNFLSPSKLSVNYKMKRKKRYSSASKSKRQKTESSSSADNIYSSTFRQTTSSSKNSSKSNKRKKISFSPIQKIYPIPFRSQENPSPCLSGNEESPQNTVPDIIISRTADKYEQDNDLEDDEDINHKVDSKDDTASKSSTTDDDESLVESFRSLSTTPEEERTDFQDLVTKTPVHVVKKKDFKPTRKKWNNMKKLKDKSIIFPRYYPLGWMAINNVGRKILKKFVTSRQAIVSPKKSNFQTFGEWKRMCEEGLILKTPTPPHKEDEYSVPIEILAKKNKTSNKKNKKQLSRMKKKEYSTRSKKKEVKSGVLSKKDIKEKEQIRENSFRSNERSIPQNLSDDFAHLVNNPNITTRRNTTNTSILENNETSGTFDKLKKKIRIISDIEFEDSTKIRVPFEIWSQYKK